jgi:hypothetical protein
MLAVHEDVRVVELVEQAGELVGREPVVQR